MPTEKPNLFKIATKELTQDSLITWLLKWSNPPLRSQNKDLHTCGVALRDLLLGEMDNFDVRQITEVRAGRQWENIDIWAEIEGADGRKILLIIEDKTFTAEHSGQLLRYKASAEKYCAEKGYELTCAFIKIGSEPLDVLQSIRERGFRVFDRINLIRSLAPFRLIGESVINEFLEYLEDLEADHQSFQRLPPKDWSDWSWIGLYQYIEGLIPVRTWHYVDRPSGGFWNLLINWEGWGHFPIYIQIEQGRLCYKVALAESETGLREGTVNVDLVQDFLLKTVLEFGQRNGYDGVTRPYYLVHRGAYRTFAVVEQAIFLGPETELIDKETIIPNIRFQIDYFNRFKAYLDEISYEDAGISVEEG